MKRLRIVAPLLGALVLTSGCGEWSTADNTTTPTTSQPTLGVTVTPSNSTVDVAPDASITAKFTLPISNATLTSSTITLQGPTSSVNGTITYDSSSNTATFTPTHRLALKTTYTLSLNDTIKSDGGSSLSNATYTFTTRDGTWGNATTISANNYFYHIAANSYGDIITVRANYTSSTSIIAKGYDNKAKSWSDEVSITANAYTHRPKISFDKDNNALAVWYESVGGGNTQIWGREYNASTDEWGNASQQVPEANKVWEADVAFDSNKSKTFIWMTSDYEIHSKRYDNILGNWENTVRLDNSTNIANSPSIAIDKEGNALATWIQYEHNTYTVYGAKYDITTHTWSNATALYTQSSNSLQEPEIAVDSKGNGLVVWEGSNKNNELRYSEYDATTNSWGNSTVLLSSSNQYFSPDIACDNQDNLYLTYSLLENWPRTVYVKKFDNATQTWGNDTALTEGEKPFIAVGGDGTVSIISSSQTSDTIVVNRYQ